MQLYYVVSDYSASGEGRTISILITQGIFEEKDYETKTEYIENSDGSFSVKEGILKRSMNFILLREFALRFGAFHYYGAEILTKDEFITRYKQFISHTVLEFLDSNVGAFHYDMQLSVNYS